MRGGLSSQGLQAWHTYNSVKEMLSDKTSGRFSVGGGVLKSIIHTYIVYEQVVSFGGGGCSREEAL